LAWHPINNVLCTVCQNEAFIFSNDSQTGALEKIKSFSGAERFTSCCWNYSGSLLIFATHSKLLFYNFTCDTADPCEPVFSFVIGKVCSLETVDQTRLLCAIELPLSDVIRHQVENISHDASALEPVSNASAASNSLVASSQLLLIGYNAIDGKPYIMTKIDIEEILTPNIMVYELLMDSNIPPPVGRVWRPLRWVVHFGIWCINQPVSQPFGFVSRGSSDSGQLLGLCIESGIHSQKCPLVYRSWLAYKASTEAGDDQSQQLPSLVGLRGGPSCRGLNLYPFLWVLL
ncbi:hypothetical protein AVEN_140567-1, partial [Araneus ventricosus]